MILTGTYTEAGQDLATRFLTGGTLTLTRIVAGSGATQRDAARMAREEQDLGLCSPTLEDHTALLRCTLNTTQASSPYSLTELGVYASDGEKEVLYLLYTLDQPFPVDPAARVVLRFNLEQTLADGASVTINAPLSGLVTQEELDKKADLVDGQVPLSQLPQLHQDVTLYVDAAAGSDENDGTRSAPFQTIQAALDALPKNLGTYRAQVRVAAGTYDEDVLVTGFVGGVTNPINVSTLAGIEVSGTTDAVVRSFRLENNLMPTIEVKDLTVQDAEEIGVLVDACPAVILRGVIISNCPTGLQVGKYYSSAGCTVNFINGSISNASEQAVYVNGTHTCFVRTYAGTGNKLGYTAQYGAQILYSGTLEAETETSTYAGIVTKV